jgi:hypothetical protein
MDEEFDIISLSLDETHRLLKKSNKVPKANWSYKLKDIAYNILVSYWFFFLIISLQ